ncbi:hypothetical protein MRB53_022777 [Persea americana]|uniref:Uncharacterized protein n=1 Tax=Persea americana TaxID=3435 RepID=A0ACC2L7L6_PERAE|nr:hypothetical protein MRB53_022777 [Persea americana]
MTIFHLIRMLKVSPTKGKKVIISSFFCCFFGSCSSEELPPFFQKIISSSSSTTLSSSPPLARDPTGFLLSAFSFPARGDSSGSMVIGIFTGAGSGGTTSEGFFKSSYQGRDYGEMVVRSGKVKGFIAFT